MALPRDIVAGLMRRLQEHAGLELPAWVVEARARGRMEKLRVAPADYVELIGTTRGRVELDELVEAVRVGETRFFRHRSQVDALVSVVAPAIAARGRRSVRVWSAGCASGEEPYTLAMVLGRELPEHNVQVIATDVSEDALALAARGRYPRAALQHVPDEWREYFEDVGGGEDEVRVRPDIAQKVSFEQQNLLDADAPRGCMVVWCRNVLIYFASEARRRVVAKLVGAMESGGWLFVGYSEQLRDVVELEAVKAADATVYVKRGVLSARTPVAGVPIQTSTVPTTLPLPSPSRSTTTTTSTSTSTSTRRLVAKGHCEGLAGEISGVLGEVGLRQLEVELDGAAVVPDEIAVVIKRAKAAAEAAGVVLVVRATRSGVLRWMRRHGL